MLPAVWATDAKAETVLRNSCLHSGNVLIEINQVLCKRLHLVDLWDIGCTLPVATDKISGCFAPVLADEAGILEEEFQWEVRKYSIQNDWVPQCLINRIFPSVSSLIIIWPSPASSCPSWFSSSFRSSISSSPIPIILSHSSGSSVFNPFVVPASGA